jgi:hypothetical protein
MKGKGDRRRRRRKRQERGEKREMKREERKMEGCVLVNVVCNCDFRWFLVQLRNQISDPHTIFGQILAKFVGFLYTAG